MKQLQIIIIMTTFLFIGCKNEVTVYESTPESLHFGSIVYASNEVNCKSCHGSDYKGNTSDAKELKEKGISVPDFTGMIPPEKTPLDYFMAISVGTNNTKSGDYNYHAYYNLTDRAKWALANFLYSLGQQPKTQEEINKRKQALQTALQQIQSVYKTNRKWYLGLNTPSQQREKSKSLQELIQNSTFKIEQEIPFIQPTEEKIKKIIELQSEFKEGAFLYKYNCQHCHGIAGEGVQGEIKINVLDESRNEPVKNISRRKSAFVSIKPLSRDTLKKETIQKEHPYYNFTENQWNHLIQYIYKILEK